MDNFFIVIGVILGFLAMVCLYRGIFGPTVVDRVIGVGVVGTKTLIILLLIGLLYKRLDMFVDIALVYAMLNFIGVLIFAKYFIRKGVL